MVYLLSYLPEADFFAWGWRIAFLISAVLVAVGLYIRLKIMETPAFTRIQETKKVAHVPFFELCAPTARTPCLASAPVISKALPSISSACSSLDISREPWVCRGRRPLPGVMIASAIMIIMLPIYGNLSDKIGRRRMFAVAGVLIGLLSFPSFWLMQTKEPFLVWLAIAIPFAFVYPAVYGPQAALFSELFDTRVRYTGISFVYQFSGIYASGLTPIIATALLPAGGGKPWLICLYVCSSASVSAASVIAMTEAHKRDMAVDNK